MYYVYVYIYTYIIHVYKCIWLFINSFCWLFTYLLFFLNYWLVYFSWHPDLWFPVTGSVTLTKIDSRILLEKICEVLPGIRAQVRDCPVGMFGFDEKLCDFFLLERGRCVIDRGNEMWIVLLMEWMFFLKNSQVVAFRISFDCFLVGFCFVSEKTSCWQPMVSPLDLFRFASVSWSYWFHFGIDNSQSPRSESGRGMCPTKHGWMAHDAAVVWCWNRSKHRKLQNDTRHVSLFTPDREMLCH